MFDTSLLNIPQIFYGLYYLHSLKIFTTFTTFFYTDRSVFITPKHCDRILISGEKIVIEFNHTYRCVRINRRGKKREKLLQFFASRIIEFSNQDQST